ncbi:MAG: hypothetical protein LBI38_06125 [Oscillospiraceae bacterium]|jgi:hypothetical protein|nr:hypothetical protein [Oscillospiraceae bacterium]
MDLTIDREEITGLILRELRAIAFGEDMKINHKLAAIRMLVKLLSLEKTLEEEEEPGVVVVNDMDKPFGSPEKDPEEPLGGAPPLNREQRRRLQKKSKRENRREAKSPARGSPPPL